jgi:uncharacterized protein YpmB
MIKNIIFVVILVVAIYITWKVATKYNEINSVADSITGFFN